MANQTTTHDQGARERANELAGSAKEHTQGVVEDARLEASAVVSEAGAQARNLVDEARSTMRHEADDGTSRAAGALGDLGAQLRALADGDVERAGEARRYAGDLAERLSRAADRLSSRGFDGVVADVQRFARRRPGLFLAAAATSGFAAGRLFRGARAESASGPGDSPAARHVSAPAVGPGTQTGAPAPMSGFEHTRPMAEPGAGPAGPDSGPMPAPTPAHGGASSAPMPDYGASADDAGGPR